MQTVGIAFQDLDLVVTTFGKPVCIRAEKKEFVIGVNQFEYVFAHLTKDGISLSLASSIQSENSFFCLLGSGSSSME